MSHPDLDLANLRAQVAYALASDMPRSSWALGPASVLALLDRIASLESERAVYHTRLAANDARAAEQARRITELEAGLREAIAAYDERVLPPPWSADSARIAKLQKLVEPPDSRCRLHFLDSDRWARCNQPRLHKGECR